MKNGTSQHLIDQISHYINDLENIQSHLHKSHPLPNHLQLLQQKIIIKISHFQTAIKQIHIKEHSSHTLHNMANYFSNVFSQTVKEAHRFLQMKHGERGQQKLNQKLLFLKQIEHEMEDEWHGQKRNNISKGILKAVGNNKAMLASQMDQKQLKAAAKDYLHKQFLTIRMVAYQMYQQYTNHSHPSLQRQINEIQKQQQDLLQQANQLNETNRQLKDEEKRLIRQLNQVKRVNDLVSKRYFVSSGSSPNRK